MFYLSKTNDFESRGVDLGTKIDTKSMYQQKYHANLSRSVQSRSQTPPAKGKMSGQEARWSPRGPRRRPKGAKTSRNGSPRSAEGALKGPRSPKESQKGDPESPKRSKRSPREPQMSPKGDRNEPEWSAKKRKGEVKGTKAAPWRAKRDT